MFVLLSQVDISDSYHGLVDERGSSVNIANEEEASCASIAILDIPASSFGFVQLPSLLSILITAHSSTFDSKFVIDKLTDSNYSLWSWRVRMLLIERDMWEIVDGTDVLADDATVAVKAAWEKKQAKALATICMLVDDSQARLIRHLTTPKDVWDTLQEQYQSTSLANELFLRQRFYRARLPEGGDISAHINSLKDIAIQLAGVGVQIADREFVMVLLGSLPDSYSGLVVALESQQVELKLPFVQQRLLHEEARRKDTSRGNDPREEVALVARNTPVSKGDRFCSFCGSNTHVKKKCFRFKKLQRSAKMTSPPEHDLDEDNHVTMFAHHCVW